MQNIEELGLHFFFNRMQEEMLVAGPMESLHSGFTEVASDEAVLYLGDLATKSLIILEELAADGTIRAIEATDLKFKCRSMLGLLEK